MTTALGQTNPAAAASAIVLPRPATARVWPVRQAPTAYRESPGAALAAALRLWTALANIACDGSAAPLPHVPFPNPLDVGVGLALLATLLWLRSVGRVVPGSHRFRRFRRQAA